MIILTIATPISLIRMPLGISARSQSLSSPAATSGVGDITSSSLINGCDAAITFTANGGAILVQNAQDAIGAFGGIGAITGGSAGVAMTAASGITLDAARVVAAGFPPVSSRISPCTVECVVQVQTPTPPDNGGSGLIVLNANRGVVELLNGGTVHAIGGTGKASSGSGRINLSFTGRASGGYFVNGVEGVIVDPLDAPTAGFFVN